MTIATQIIAPLNILTRVCAEATPIPKGTVMKLTDTNTVEASAASNDPFGGITTEEFTGGEGLTHVGVAYDSGVFQMDTTAAAIGIGVPVSIGGANSVRALIEADVALGCKVGVAEMTRTETNSIRVRLTGA